jgi:hypothetical protein
MMMTNFLIYENEYSTPMAHSCGEPIQITQSNNFSFTTNIKTNWAIIKTNWAIIKTNWGDNYIDKSSLQKCLKCELLMISFT